MILIALALAVAGVIQTYFQRVLGMDFFTTQGYMRLWFAVFWASAWGFAIGATMYIIDFFSIRRTA